MARFPTDLGLVAEADFGASRPLPRVRPKVFLLNPQPVLRLGGRNRPLCPFLAVRYANGASGAVRR
jgi:hypothetical protein